MKASGFEAMTDYEAGFIDGVMAARSFADTKIAILEAVRLLKEHLRRIEPEVDEGEMEQE